jgi:(E)-4-hydroxy-3-methylbut-2-enyl-diphosphate synthase
MDREGMDYPLHLGVTEAGDGEDGRVKSMAGIATLLEDGLGDTLRVSLTEEPENEMPVGYRIARRYSGRVESPGHEDGAADWIAAHPTDAYRRRETAVIRAEGLGLGGGRPVRVWTRLPFAASAGLENLGWLRGYRRGPNEGLVRPEILFADVSTQKDVEGFRLFAEGAKTLKAASAARVRVGDASVISGLGADWICLEAEPGKGGQLAGAVAAVGRSGAGLLVELPDSSWEATRPLLGEVLDACARAGLKPALAIRGGNAGDSLRLYRALVASLAGGFVDAPVVLWLKTDETAEEAALSASTLFGAGLLDGVGDALALEAGSKVDAIGLAYTVLQSTGARISRTEFISCPSCGRTLFDLQEVTAAIKRRTGHLVGVKIAIMGCIVNGPGEMADADFGYVGGAPGMINLYVGKECVVRGIPMAEAETRLVELIKGAGRWTQPLEQV